MKLDGVFETVLALNKDYVDAVERGERQEVQENLLKCAKIVFEKQVLDVGRATEYHEYCIKKQLIYGSVF